MTDGGQRKWEQFPTETVRRLFDAVDVDDVIDSHVALPDPIVLACSDEMMRRGYALSLQFWKDGFTHSDLLQLVHKLLRSEGLSADERLQYKYIRARYKHLRFAQKLYSKHHTTDRLFDLTTRALGHLQDAFRSGRHNTILSHGINLRLLLTKPVWLATLRAMERTRLDSAAGFLAYRKAEILHLKKKLANASFSGNEFHDVRKIVSQQLSFYDTLRSLEPNEHDRKMSRFLAAINGLMGARHDEMVADALSGRRKYGTPGSLSKETRWRLETLIAHYPL